MTLTKLTSTNRPHLERVSLLSIHDALVDILDTPDGGLHHYVRTLSYIQTNSYAAFHGPIDYSSVLEKLTITTDAEKQILQRLLSRDNGKIYVNESCIIKDHDTWNFAIKHLSHNLDNDTVNIPFAFLEFAFYNSPHL